MELPFQSSTAVLIIIALICYSQFSSYRQRHSSSVPIVESTWLAFLTRRGVATSKLLKDAYNKYSKNGQLYRMSGPAGGFQYILPLSVLNEARKIPSTTMDAIAANEEILVLNPFIGKVSEDVVTFVSGALTRIIPSWIPVIADEVAFTLKKNFPPEGTASKFVDGKEYYSMLVHPATLTSISSVIGRIMLGQQYARNALWTRKIEDFAQGLFMQSLLLRRLPRWFVDLIANLTPTARRVRELSAMIRGDIINCMNSTKSDDTVSKEPLGLQMLVEYVKTKHKYREASEDKIIEGVSLGFLRLLFAMIDTTSLTFTQVLYDVVGYPRDEYVEPMLAEIKEVKARHRELRSAKALGDLKLLDSFIRESQRLHTLGATLGARLVLVTGGYTFKASPDHPDSTPLYLPQGSRLEIPVGGVHTDPSIYPDPETFQGFRFVADGLSSAQISEKFLSFGFGNHACPGRFLALAIIKIMAVEFMLHYEWEEAPRLKDWTIGGNLVPNMRSKVSIRRKNTEESVVP